VVSPPALSATAPASVAARKREKDAAVRRARVEALEAAAAAAPLPVRDAAPAVAA
jgi:BMFP domain-containing protein YqiC